MNLIIVDDDPAIRDSLSFILTKEGYKIDTVPNMNNAIEKISREKFDIMLLDVMLPEGNSIEYLPTIKEKSPNLIIIMMTAYGSFKDAIEAGKKGAWGFISKPLDFKEICQTIKNAAAVSDLYEQNKELQASLNQNIIIKGVIGVTPKMQKVLEIIRKVVNYDVTVLISGESGTGKELIAHAIHHNSARRNGPFLKLNCAALPEALLESELFGYEKGAFTGALNTKPGRFELAREGTLFLDEICDTSLAMQAKLLRVLQEKEFERVGGTQTIKADVRIVCATNKNIKEEVEAGKFRADLFYRLNVVNIELPPLRERKEDIPAIVFYIIKELNQSLGKNYLSVSDDAMQCLVNYKWPGNIRELKNILERAMLLGDGNVITTTLLPEEIINLKYSSDNFKISTNSSLEELEKKKIEEVLQQCLWNQTKASEMLGIHRNTLREKMKKYNIREK
jgi:two-component system response regulator AtoC